MANDWTRQYAAADVANLDLTKIGGKRVSPCTWIEFVDSGSTLVYKDGAGEGTIANPPAGYVARGEFRSIVSLTSGKNIRCGSGEPPAMPGGVGPTGPAGATGATGAAGATGATGAAGATGAQGMQGPQGMAGTDGASPKATLSPGAPGIWTQPASAANATVNASGNLSAFQVGSVLRIQDGSDPARCAHVQLVSVVGSSITGKALAYSGDIAQGATITAGTIAVAGIQGPTGATGATGAAGAQGAQGIQGATGAAGDATAYTPGADAYWTDPNPTTIAQALDRLAAAVSSNGSSPIP